jgi:2-polyprenyl-6-methoxyphenol hydroxylase-like FAD-dependent oxidoreductase
MSSEPRVLIIGGGIGGLTAALALRQVGFNVAVFERASELAEIGAGITLWTNAVKVLRILNVADAVCDAGHIIERGELRSWRGDVLVVTPVGEVGRKLGAPSVGLHRAALQQELFRKLGEGVIHLGAACVNVEQDTQGVTAYYSNGRTERGAILIGADGLRSTVGETFLRRQPLRYAGYICYRGITRLLGPSLPPGYAFESWGPGRRFGAIRMDSQRIYWFANLSVPPSSSDPTPKRTLRAQFDRWHAPIAEIIDSTEEAAVLRHEVYDRKPEKHWGMGRISLLGDAAHPMTPDLGQGACQAIEDAIVLARCISGTEDYCAALRLYESRRWKRVSDIVKRSRWQGWIAQQSSPLACRVRDFMTKAVPTALMRRAYELNVRPEE